MKTPTWKPVKLCEKDGFNLVLSFEEEQENPKDHFIEGCGWSDKEYESIKEGYWFCAKITAYKGVIACGDSYLGCNSYASLNEVLQDYKGSLESCLSGYAKDLIDEAIQDAVTNLK